MYIANKNKIYKCTIKEITEEKITVEIPIKDFIAYGYIKPEEEGQYLFKTKKDAEKYLKENSGK